MAVMIFLNGLLPRFGMVKAHILSDSRIPSLDDAFACVLRIESSPTGLSIPQSSSALISKNNNLRVPQAMDNNSQRNIYDHRKPDSVEIVCNCCYEFAKFQNYQDLLQASFSSTLVASTVAPDGSTSSVLGSGTIHFTPSFSLSLDRVTKKIIGRGCESGDLYLFDHQVPQVVACLVVPSPFEVHCRLDVHPHHTKLNTKSLKCIFLGYLHVQKGYRCYCPTLKRLPLPHHPLPLLRLLLACCFLEYSRRPPPQSSDSCPPSMPPSSCNLGSSDDLLVALREGKRKCTYLVSSFVSYHQLSPPTYAFITSPDSTSIPNIVHEALSHFGWRNAMIEEMNALDGNGTWDLVSRSAGKKTIGCKWVFVVKVDPDGVVARLKARLVAKCYVQICRTDYLDAFSPVA
ncbi:Cysteine-rich RLK (RECEPTOR-like protein kinase) 8 [Cucumis melo var. makuwa]|uniref:Cysteine-rich RLK (RECEPTOR-like protein kinase) 8 n=1 Tax=Cucumis melo var. makuwa TaxID=1194695 RepID=A0A5A7T376_CUCMM|nr:Cysteine-rich RLK (RECEPTOR-like protein kinase) 8 [Cucumis melo var. makuwa]